MSRGGQVTADAVRDMLVGLAEALRTAQEILAEDARAGDFAGASYAIPYLDFAFDVEFTTREETSTAAPILMLRPKPGSSRTTTEISSRISGRLVSLPPHAGRPAPLLDLRTVRDEEGRGVEITLANTAGEILAGVPVALQVDVEMTERLTGTRPDADQRLGLLAAQGVRTDAAGHARVALDMGQLGTTERVVLLAEAEGVSARIVLSREAE